MTKTPSAGLTPSGTLVSTDDVYARMLRSNMESAIEDIILIDEGQTSEPVVCTCGKCDQLVGVAETADEMKIRLGGAPMYYIETRANSDPIVLDEYTVAADIEIISPRMIARKDDEIVVQIEDESSGMLFGAPQDDFDPASFDPFDPGIPSATDLLVQV